MNDNIINVGSNNAAPPKSPQGLQREVLASGFMDLEADICDLERMAKITGMLASELANQSKGESREKSDLGRRDGLPRGRQLH